MKKTLHAISAKAAVVALVAGASWSMASPASAIGSGDADTLFNGFNNAYLINGNYYRDHIGGSTMDYGWTGAFDIQVAEDAYERTGSATHKNLVYTLCTTFLQMFPPGYTWDGWNDDVAWIGIALARGAYLTADANLLNQARTSCFDMVWTRGWDTQYNGGGIWEVQPNMATPGQQISKAPLSNNTMIKLACLIYMSNHDQWYLDRATQIYSWSRSHLFNTSTGQVYPWIDRNNVVDTNPGDADVYNQGTFADAANYLYQITGNAQYYNDAKLAIDYVKNTMYNNGVITTGQTGGWSDEFARGIGHFCRDNRMWGTYYNWMTLNANAIMSRRRTDYNLTWNKWDQQTPIDNNSSPQQYTSAAAWLQYTPVSMPNNIWGRHVIVGMNNMAIDCLGLTANNSIVGLWGLGPSQNQIWDFSQNSDGSWNIVNEVSWKALNDPGASTANGTKMVQWNATRDSNSRWWVDVQSDGAYKIWNQASGLALDSSSTTTNGQALVQWSWVSTAPQQRWRIQ